MPKFDIINVASAPYQSVVISDIFQCRDQKWGKYRCLADLCLGILGVGAIGSDSKAKNMHIFL